MRRCLLVAALLLTAAGAWGKPALRPVKVTLPDGTEKIVLRYGRCKNRLHARVPEFAKNYVRSTRGPGLYDYSFPCTGKQKVLVILVEFKDVKFNSKNKAQYSKTDAHTYFSEMLNKKGFDTYGGTGSARDWFLDNSNGKFDPEFDVYGPVSLPQNMKYYGANNYSGDDVRAYQMVVDACKALDGEINFRDYDRNGDGYVDNVYVFYAGYGEADSDEEDAVWPHSWEISSATAPNNWTSGDPLTLDGVNIDRYACSNETCGIIGYDDRGNSIYADRPDGIGTFVHEFSHVMGLPDLYYTGSYEDNSVFTPGAFSVMDYGPYNNDGRTPPNYSTYERYALDWITPEVMPSGNRSLENLADCNKAFIVKTDREQEFFLFENRQQTGWDEYIPGHGMLVWHIDFDEQVFYDNAVNNTRNHQYVDLVEADNVQSEYSREADPFPGTRNKTSFGSLTRPSLRSWSGGSTGVELTDISESGGKIFFTAAVEESAVDEIDAEPDVLLTGDVYDMRGIKVGRVEEGRMPPLDSGVYIVKSATQTKKLLLKRY